MPPAEIENTAAEPLGVSSPPVMVHVVAPATLPAGYTFEAQIGNESEKTFTVTVPEGGVKEGQTFLAPLPDGVVDGPRVVVPTGAWKDGLCDFCTYGPCHPHFCCSLWFTQIGMGQVMQRLNLTWLGFPGPEAATRNTFKVVVTLFVCYVIFSFCMDMLKSPDPEVYTPEWISFLDSLVGFLFALWSIMALCKTRENVRAKYSIPEERCNGCEDICCSCFCSCCTVAQMLRHTGEYEKYKGTCCSETGLPDGAPAVV